MVARSIFANGGPRNRFSTLERFSCGRTQLGLIRGRENPMSPATLGQLAFFTLALRLLGCASTPPLPRQAIELNQQGVASLERGDLELADTRFSLALEYSPRFVDAWTNLGLVELQRGNFRRADQLLSRARRLNPDLPQPHHGLGLLEERRGRLRDAMENYREALEVDPGFLASRLNLTRLLFLVGEVEQARIEARKAVESGSESPAPLSAMTEILLRLGRLDEADQVLTEGRARFPDDPELTIQEARRRLRTLDFEGALALLTPLTGRRDETGANALAWVATLELARHDLARARAAATRALALVPDLPLATHVLARVTTELGAPEAAVYRARAELLTAAPAQRP
jgi:tetratricopeptide (TPR) repeat protein